MLTRTRLVLTAAVAGMAAAVLVLSIVAATRYAHRTTAGAEVPAPLAVGTELQRPRALPPVRLVDQTGAATSLFFNASRVGSILSGVLSGVIVGALGYRAAFLLCAALAICAFVLLSFDIAPIGKRRTEPPRCAAHWRQPGSAIATCPPTHLT